MLGPQLVVEHLRGEDPRTSRRFVPQHHLRVEVVEPALDDVHRGRRAELAPELEVEEHPGLGIDDGVHLVSREDEVQQPGHRTLPARAADPVGGATEGDRSS